MRLGAPDECTLPDERANYHHLVLEIAWFGLALAATSRFLSVYAIRLGASPIELGWIASLPAIVLLVSSSFAGWWRGRHQSTVKALRIPAFGFRLLFLLPAFAPFFPLELQPVWLIAAVALPAIPQGIAGVNFLVMMRESVHDEYITSLMSKRMMVLNVGVALSALGFGLWLEKAPFPFNYQAMFLVAFGFALVSQRYCMKVSPMKRADVPASTVAVESPWRSPRFLRVAFIVVVTFVAFTAIVPLTPLHLMNNLGATEGFMALFGLVELSAGAAASLMTPRIVGRMGNQAMISLAMIGTALAAVSLALTPSLPLSLAGAALSGASWTAATIGIFGFFSESTPPEAMTRYSTAYQQMTGLAMFLGPMLGSALVNGGSKVVLVLLLGAGLRLLAGALTEYDVFVRVTRVSRTRMIGALRTK